jgi:hypothetical protein
MLSVRSRFIFYRSPGGETALDVAERRSTETSASEEKTPFALLMLRLLEKREELQAAFFEDLADVLAQAYDEDSPPLLTAVEREDDDYVMCLLDNGCPVNTKDKDGNTALLVAACLGRLGTVECLIDRGADVKATNAVGATALHQSCQRNLAQLAALLLERGADVNDVTFRGGISPNPTLLGLPRPCCLCVVALSQPPVLPRFPLTTFLVLPQASPPSCSRPTAAPPTAR